MKTILGFKKRPSVKRLKNNPWGVEIGTPFYPHASTTAKPASFSVNETIWRMVIESSTTKTIRGILENLHVAELPLPGRLPAHGGRMHRTLALHGVGARQ